MQSFFWSFFSCVRTKYGELQSKFPHSDQEWEITYQKKTQPNAITLNTALSTIMVGKEKYFH